MAEHVPNRRGVGLLALALVLSALAALTSSSARSASVKSCPNGDCLTVTVLPDTISAGRRGVAVAQLSNLGPGTMNHVTITFAVAGSTLGAISSDVPGAQCDGTGCALGQIRGFGSATVFATFKAGQTGDVTATLQFDESNDTPPTTDTVVKTSAIVVSPDKDEVGACLVRPGQTLVGATPDRAQLVAIAFAPPSGGLPCSPVGASIGTTPPSGFTERIVTVDLLFDPSHTSFGSVDLKFATLPAGSNFRTFVLREIVGDPNADPLQTVVVGQCDQNGRPPTGDPTQSSDSCVLQRERFRTKGAELTLNVLAADPGYVG